MKRMVVQLVVAAVLLAGGLFVWQMLADGSNGAGAPAGGPGGDRAVPVEVADARMGEVVERVEAVGTTRARESVDVVAEVSGRVAAIGFEEGERVSAGRTLIELDTAGERASLREAQAQREEVRKQLDRARQLLRTNNVPQARVDELVSVLEAASARVAMIEVRLRDREIRAPFDGVVGLREVSVGAYVGPQQRITTLDDTSVVRLEFAVPERFLGRLATGLGVSGRSAAWPGEEFDGVLTHIDTRVDPATRSVRVQAELPNTDGRLRPGMFLGVDLIMERREAVLVPEEAIVSEGQRHSVFVIANGRAERRQVALGVRTRGEVELREGVHADEPVVVLGLQRVRDGASVRILNERAAQVGS